jgi:ADP-heptose:LPS heptosyltransferase
MDEKRLVNAEFPPYREGTKIEPTKIALVYNAGGIGDYIHWTNAIRYAIDSNPHIYGKILAPHYFYALADLWLGKHSDRFSVHAVGELRDSEHLKDCAAIVPDNKQLINACGFHLTDLGFYYYTQKKHIPPAYAVLPPIEGDEVDIKHFELPEKYVVIPTEATSSSRMMPDALINKLTGFLMARNIKAVFLGKTDMAEGYTSKNDGCLITEAVAGVIDLRNKTTLVEAACIMARASLVIGMDGGLLHLAACSRVPVVFIFTSVHPSLRIPKRREGTRSITVTPPKELTCRFCNTGEPGGPSMSYVIGHDFKNCLYGDNVCTQMIRPETLLDIMGMFFPEGR